ncbi:hypothetical protein V1520DRAFT_332550 [Lipomyces starkeyi]
MSAPGSVFQRLQKFFFSKDLIRWVDFAWPVSNFGIPIAAVMDTKKDPILISGPMTGSLILYSLVFMRYSMAITPKNYLLFGCHFVNECAQLTQGFRYLNYWQFGGREKSLAEGSSSN